MTYEIPRFSDYKALLFVYLTGVRIFFFPRCGCVFLIRAEDLLRVDQRVLLVLEIRLSVLILLVLFSWFNRVWNLREWMDYAVTMAPNEVLMGDFNGVGFSFAPICSPRLY